MDNEFADFNKAYKTVLVKDLEDKFEQLAAAANFNIYHSDIWRGTARLFAESIVRECAEVVAKDMDYDANWCGDKILKHFGVK